MLAKFYDIGWGDVKDEWYMFVEEEILCMWLKGIEVEVFEVCKIDYVFTFYSKFSLWFDGTPN